MPPVRARVLLRSSRSLIAVATLTLLSVVSSACGSSSASDSSSAKDKGPASTLRLGFFANITHATALVGVDKGLYAKELGSTQLKTQVFNAGPAAVEAIFAGAVDATYVGPNPAINAFSKSHGEAVRIIAGATSGGAQLVVKPSIASAAQLKGKKLATPQRGNTQDVALRAWLASQGLKTDLQGGGDVSVNPADNATTLQAFKTGQIDGAWVPEPWASRLVLEGGGKVLVDEASLWPQGKFVTTQLLVTTKFLKEHPETVAALLRAQVAINDWIAKNPADAKAAANDELQKLSGKALKPAVLDRAWSKIQITNDPVAPSLAASAEHATAAGLLKKTDLHGIYDLGPLNQALGKAGKPAVSDGGLGEK
jgi:NitT/TauT family transport system substrate-binding protein